MGILGHTSVKKVTASMLFMLMLVIFGIKVLHHHAAPATLAHGHPEAAHTITTPTFHHCDICDFQPAREAVIAVSSITFCVPLPQAVSYAQQVVTCIVAYHTHTSLRGPPVTA